MSKVTVVAPANIAFVKYWGARDLDQAIPRAPSLSMTLRQCTTRTTVAFAADEDGEDEVRLRTEEGTFRVPGASFTERVRQHLDRLRQWMGQAGTFRVATENTFPSGAGLASSASGFAALTVAATRTMGLVLEPEQLSVLARLSGSGSAARSVMGGYVEWPDMEVGDYPAMHLAGADHWDLRDVIAVVDPAPKTVSSRDGHRRAGTSPFYETRLQHLDERLEQARVALRHRDFEQLGPLIEEEAIELHLIAMSSRPPIYYWKPATLAVLEAVRGVRTDGVAAYATMDAGPNVHVICPAAEEAAVANRLERLPEVEAIIRDGVGPGPSTTTEHLF